MDGPEGTKALKPVSWGYYQLMTDPGLPFSIMAAEKKVEAEFGPFHLVGYIDQIWQVDPCPAYEKGGRILVDLTMGSGPGKYAQLTIYSLLFRLKALRDKKFREEIFGIPEDVTLDVEEAKDLLRETAVGVIPLSDCELKESTRGDEDYEWLREELERAASLVKQIMRGESVSPKPLDAVCNWCAFAHDCQWAKPERVINLQTGGFEVLASPEKIPPPGKQKYFPRWKQGRIVKQEVTREKIAQMPMFALPEG